MALDIASIGTQPLPHPQAQNHPPVEAGLPGGTPTATPMPAAAAKSLVPPPAPLIPSDLQETIQELQKLSAAFNRHLSFSINSKLDSIIVKVVDSETDKVIR